MINSITITATAQGAKIELIYKGIVYKQEVIPTDTGARHTGCCFHDENQLPDCIVEELESFTAYNLMRALQKAR